MDCRVLVFGQYDSTLLSTPQTLHAQILTDQTSVQFNLNITITTFAIVDTQEMYRLLTRLIFGLYPSMAHFELPFVLHLGETTTITIELVTP